MIQISNRVNALSPSATMAMSQKSAEMRAAGIDVINMSVGEPDFDTPDFIKKAAEKAIEENYTRYTAAAGYLSLREAVCRKLKRENGLDFEPSQIVVGNGAKQELSNVLLAVINPGDEVIIPTPAWVSYIEMVKLAEGVPVTISTGVECNFKITPDQLRAAITEKTRALMINTPSNPTGSIYTLDELRALAAVVAEYPDIVIIADDIYEHISYVDQVHSIAEIPEVKDQTVIINGVSKAYAMTGWRIGYMAAPLRITKAVVKLQGQTTSGVSSIAQKAAEAALDGPQECVENMRVAFEKRRNLIVELAAKVPGWTLKKPDGAFYIFPHVEPLFGKSADGKVINNGSDYVEYLLEEAHVACVDGAAFNAPGYIRLSYATSEELIREAMDRIYRATAKLV